MLNLNSYLSQGWNLGIAAEMTKNSSGKDKFKDWREFKIIENEHIFKDLVSHIWSGAFLVNFGHISHNIPLFLLLILNRLMLVGKAK